MSENNRRFTGGCLCGALRYEADGEPLYTGHCYCADCQKASGSGFIPFMGFASSAVRFSGPTRQFTSKAANGGDAVRNSCPVCSSLVFGGVIGESDSFTIYAGSLDDTSLFQPSMAIFSRSRAPWALIPPGLKVFETMPAAT
ncbi:MAG: GFA family protein [Gammaproteobacteria bacterium]